jgi:hypothetical protein
MCCRLPEEDFYSKLDVSRNTIDFQVGVVTKEWCVSAAISVDSTKKTLLSYTPGLTARLLAGHTSQERGSAVSVIQTADKCVAPPI